MSAKFLEGFGGKLAEQWIANLLTPAFVFWSGGLLAYIHRHGWESIAKYFPDSKLEPLQVAILAIVLIVILISSLFVQRFDTEVLRGLEGYWYSIFRRLGKPILQYATQRQIKQRNHVLAQWRSLHQTSKTTPLSARDRAEFVRCDRTLRQFPILEEDFLPTRLGNILRAAERRPFDRYGLDSIICWPRLWFLLPDSAKKDLQESRAELNNGVRLFSWSILFLIWSFWSGWAIPCGIISASFAYSWILDSAVIYGDLMESAFDLYRFSLYQSLRFPLPKTIAEEEAMGLKVTEYLFRGTYSPGLDFRTDAGKSGDLP
jgi:hypothetical protein